MKVLANIMIWLAVIGGVMAVALRVTCLRSWRMPADDALLALSVMPTLEAGDLLILYRGSAPGYGDLVRCPDPEAQGRYVVGRILGESGDRVAAEQASVTVNDKVVHTLRGCSPSQLSVFDSRSGETVDLSCEVEEAGGGEYNRARATSALPPTLPFRAKVGDGQVYLASDDRYLHDDSRDFGLLPKESCSEHIVFRLWGARGWFDQPRRMMFIR